MPTPCSRRTATLTPAGRHHQAAVHAVPRDDEHELDPGLPARGPHGDPNTRLGLGLGLALTLALVLTLALTLALALVLTLALAPALPLTLPLALTPALALMRTR